MLIPHANDCSTTLDIEIKVVISEGLIWAINKSNPTVKLWQHQVSTSIVIFTV